MRPSFEDILMSLDEIVHSAFTQTPHESFHTLQDVWKIEIEQVLDGLKMKEKVRHYKSDNKLYVKFTKSFLPMNNLFIVSSL